MFLCIVMLYATGPSGRWGHAMCNISDNKTVLIGGQGAKHQMVKDALWVISTDETGNKSIPAQNKINKMIGNDK